MGDAPVLATRDEFGEAGVFLLEHGVVHALVSSGSGSATVAAATAEDADHLARLVSELLGDEERPETEVAVAFWTAGTHGPRSVLPGTGKTTALRALARVWSDWCATHFITDPEEFLGHGTAYLLEVLTAEPARPKHAAIR